MIRCSCRTSLACLLAEYAADLFQMQRVVLPYLQQCIVHGEAPAFRVNGVTLPLRLIQATKKLHKAGARCNQIGVHLVYVLFVVFAFHRQRFVVVARQRRVSLCQHASHALLEEAVEVAQVTDHLRRRPAVVAVIRVAQGGGGRAVDGGQHVAQDGRRIAHQPELVGAQA